MSNRIKLQKRWMKAGCASLPLMNICFLVTGGIRHGDGLLFVVISCLRGFSLQMEIAAAGESGWKATYAELKLILDGVIFIGHIADDITRLHLGK